MDADLLMKKVIHKKKVIISLLANPHVIVDFTLQEIHYYEELVDQMLTDTNEETSLELEANIGLFINKLAGAAAVNTPSSLQTADTIVVQSPKRTLLLDAVPKWEGEPKCFFFTF